MTDARLKSFADRIDRLEEERKAIGGDVRDVYVEVKSAGYNPKALRKVLADRRRKTDDQLEAEIERYRAALGVPGATYRGVAEQIGVSKSKLQRLVPRKNHGTPHDPETGEVLTIAPEGPVTSNTAPFDPNVPTTFTASEVAVPPGDGAAPASNDAAGTPSPSIEESCGDEGGPSQPAMRGEASAFVETGGAALAASPQAGVEPGPQDTDPQSAAMDRMVALGQEIDADDLAIPPFLRGSRQRVAA